MDNNEVGELFKIDENDINSSYVPDKSYSVEELLLLSTMKRYVYHNFHLKEHVKINKALNLQREEIKIQIQSFFKSRKQT